MEQKVVYCPKCNRKVMSVSIMGTLPYSVKCKECNKIVSYNPVTNEIKMKDIPVRSLASGKRIY